MSFARAFLPGLLVLSYVLSSSACSSSSNANDAGSAGSASAGSSGSSGAGGNAGDGGASGSGTAGGAGAGGGTLASSDSVDLIVEPSDSGDAIVNAINSAQSSVHVEVYLLTDNDVINGLIARHQAGLDVKVLLNQDFYGSSTNNQTAYQKLSTAGVPVRWAPSVFNLTHEKCVLIDGTQAWIMTMNLAYSSPTKNREYLAKDTELDDVNEAETIFEGDWSGTPVSNPQGKLVVAPDNARTKLLDLINSATSSIDLEGEELGDTDIVLALKQKKTEGVSVRVVLASGSSSTTQAGAVKQLTQSGVPVVTVTTPYIHAKTIVVDRSIAYVGSENFTYNSLNNNRELGLITRAPAAVSTIASTLDQDFAAGAP